MTGGGESFACVQLEFGFLLGPADGRYQVRRSHQRRPESIVVLTTLGAPPRRLLERRRRRPRRVRRLDPTPVPTARASVIDTAPLGSAGQADEWLDRLRGDRDRLEQRVAEAVAVLNRLMSAHRAAAQDPYAYDVHADRALVVRVGHGTGEQVADGRFRSAYEVRRPSEGARRVERLSPQERLAALLGGREPTLAADELVLRARADLAAGRGREAALQSRIALECVLEELSGEPGELRAELEDQRQDVSSAAARALAGDLDEAATGRLEGAVGRMERAIRRYRARQS